MRGQWRMDAVHLIMSLILIRTDAHTHTQTRWNAIQFYLLPSKDNHWFHYVNTINIDLFIRIMNIINSKLNIELICLFIYYGFVRFPCIFVDLNTSLKGYFISTNYAEYSFSELHSEILCQFEEWNCTYFKRYWCGLFSIIKYLKNQYSDQEFMF